MRRRVIATWLAAVPTLAVIALWALASLPIRAATPIEVERRSSSPSSISDPFDLRPFQTARLWAEPQEPAGSGGIDGAAVSAGSPLRLQLLGITSDNGTLVACFYEPDGDRILLLRSGERLGTHTVERVSAREVAFRGGDGGEVLVALTRPER
jgi:hypothetical protein